MVSQRLLLVTVLLTAALIGGNFTNLKFALDHTTPLLLASMRTVIGGIFLLTFALHRGEKLPTAGADLRNIFVVSFSITTVSSALLIYGVNRVPAGVGSLVASTMPLFTAGISVLLISAKISRLAGVGLAIGFGGTAVLASPSLGGESTTIGIGSLVLSAVAWAFGTVYIKWKDFTHISPIMLVGVQLIMSSVVLVPFALIVEGTADTDFSLGLLWPLLYAAIPANAVTFSLMAFIVKQATPTVAASTAYLIPVFGVFFGWLIRDEVLGVIEAIGGALVVLGVYVVVTANARAATLQP